MYFDYAANEQGIAVFVDTVCLATLFNIKYFAIYVMNSSLYKKLDPFWVSKYYVKWWMLQND